ncbi:hypothetical protein F4779DRAFT_261526 [Xylariaceae sp. FL0662B]|nr:hypothetical protein F4779DRAFT_261526 [Xylariaceae sp. FL0662B]
MSSPAGAAPSAPPAKDGKGKKGMAKVLYRVRSVFKKSDSKKKATPTSEPVVAAAPAAAAPPKKPPQYEGATTIPRIQIHEERARKLGARFGLEIKPSEWHSTEGEVLRVEKSVRMRIHRECHLCHSGFGAGNKCPNCEHIRCKNCTRYPVKRNEAEQQANRERREALIRRNKENAPIIPSYDYVEKIILTQPCKTGVQDRVFKGKPRMRVRRTCHECGSLITANAKQTRTCDNCGHRRCDDCPRNPLVSSHDWKFRIQSNCSYRDARKKYPYGYPNDEPGRHFKGVYACHECKKKFPANTEDGTECQNCSHKKCTNCPRVKPRKVEPEPDPEIIEALRLHLEGLTTSDT